MEACNGGDVVLISTGAGGRTYGDLGRCGLLEAVLEAVLYLSNKQKQTGHKPARATIWGIFCHHHGLSEYFHVVKYIFVTLVETVRDSSWPF